MEDDWENEDFTPQVAKKDILKSSWDDEDVDDDDVKESWEEEEQAPPPVKAPEKPAKKAASKETGKKGKDVEEAKETALDPIAEKLRQQRLVEEADYKATTELFARKGDDKTLDNFIPKSESDFLEYAELISHKLRPYEKSFHYIGLLKAVMRLSTTSLKAADAKEVASSVTAIANEKLKAEKEANAGKKKTGDEFLTSPQLGNTPLQNPLQQQIPSEIPLENTSFERQSSPLLQGSNSHHDESQEENLLESPQYLISTPKMQTSKPIARTCRIWSVAEDEALIGLYLQISDNALVGTNQKASELWRKVHEAYSEAQTEKPHILHLRPLKSLETHWRRMAKDILQWTTCYEEASGSGCNVADRIRNASKMFHVLTGHNFTYLHGIEMVKQDPKWRLKLRWALSKEERKACGAGHEEGRSRSGKRSRVEVKNEVPTDGFLSPPGVKITKANKRRCKAVTVDSALISISEKMKVCNEFREMKANLRQQMLELDIEKEKRTNTI